jgi:hypothetical protein
MPLEKCVVCAALLEPEDPEIRYAEMKLHRIHVYHECAGIERHHRVSVGIPACEVHRMCSILVRLCFYYPRVSKRRGIKFRDYYVQSNGIQTRCNIDTVRCIVMVTPAAPPFITPAFIPRQSIVLTVPDFVRTIDAALESTHFSLFADSPLPIHIR